MFPFIIPAIGAVGGAILNKKDPLKGALIGGGLGALGGLGLSGAAGAMGGSGAALGGQQAGMLAAQEAGLGGAAMGWKGATAGVPGLLNTATQPGLLGTAGNALQTASTVQGMMPPDQPAPQAPPFQTGGGNNSLTGTYQNMQHSRLAQQQADQQQRMNRFARINRMG